MKLRAGISNAATEVKETAEKIGNSVQWNTVALVSVTIVSTIALVIATMTMAMLRSTT